MESWKYEERIIGIFLISCFDISYFNVAGAYMYQSMCVNFGGIEHDEVNIFNYD